MDKENEQSTTSRGWLWAAVVLAALPVLLANPGIVVGETVTSRLATVYALVHHGDWYIDRPSDQAPNPFEVLTVDKVKTPQGRIMSSKPPVLPLLMTAEYVVARRLFGWDLDNETDLRPLLRMMIFSLIKLPYLLGLFFFALIADMFMADRRRAMLAVVVMGFATPIVGYACQINNHTPAAAALIGALYFGLGIYTERLKPTPWRFALFGLCSATVFTMDMPVTIFPAALGALLFLRHPRESALWCGLGAAPLLLVHFGVMALVTGNPLPVQLREDMYNFRNSYWRNPIGVDGLNEGRLTYLFHMSLGRFGTFLLFPILLPGVYGFFKALRDPNCPARMAVAATGLALVVMTAYYVFETNNYGGAAYGFRWHIGATPVLMLLSMPVLAALRRPAHWFIFGLLLLVSLYSSWECLQAPWGASHEWTCRWLFGPVY